MVSSAAFSVVACKYIWATPLAAALGLGVNLTEDGYSMRYGDQLEEELASAVNNALELTRANLRFEYQKEILDELSQMVIQPERIEEFIESADAYQSGCYTEKDKRDILNVFDYFFKREITTKQCLNNWYVLTSEQITLENLKEINNRLKDQNKKIDEMKNEVSGITKILSDGKKVCIKLMNSFTFILVSMALFMVVGIAFKTSYEISTLAIAAACYGVSDFLIFFLCIEGYIDASLNKVPLKKPKSSSIILYKKLVTFTIPVILTVSCFWIVSFSIGKSMDEILEPTIGLVFGSITSMFLRQGRSLSKLQ